MGKTILIDLDGTVADFVTSVLSRYNPRYNDNMTAADINQYAMHLCVKPECGTKIYSIYSEKHMFMECLPLPGAVDGVRELKDKGHEIYFVTKPVDFSLHCMSEKQRWVDYYFPEVGHDRMIFTGQKHLVRGEALIDDHADNLKYFRGTRILVDQPWNQDVDDFSNNLIRLKTWPEIIKELDNL